MAKQQLNVGTVANDGTGDNLRAANIKINDNTNEIYSALGNGSNLQTLVNNQLELDVPVDANKVNKISFHVASTAALNTVDASAYHGAILHNHQTGTIYVAHAGSWNPLLMDTSGGPVTNYTDPLSTVAYSGSYTDLTNKPAFALNDIADVDTVTNAPSAGSVLKYDGTKWAPGVDVAQGGQGTDADTLDGQDSTYYLNYANLTNVPTTYAWSTITSTPTTTTGYGIDSLFDIKNANEIIDIKTGASGTVVHDTSSASVFYHTSVGSNFTANFTNLQTTNNRVTSVVIAIQQGATAYIPSAVQVGGSPIIIKWLGGSAPTGNANKLDIFSFNIFRTGNAWTNLTGILSTYG